MLYSFASHLVSNNGGKSVCARLYVCQSYKDGITVPYLWSLHWFILH
jgi:hypothetical protein